MKQKKILYIIGCALGAGMVGFFANQLTNSIIGPIMFCIGVFLMVVCMNRAFKDGEKDK